MIQDMTLPFPPTWNGAFDLVHSRFALVGAQAHPMRDVFDRLWGSVKLGGWIQVEEMDMVQPWSGVVAKKLGRFMKEMLGLMVAGQSMDMRGEIHRWIEELGVGVGVSSGQNGEGKLKVVGERVVDYKIGAALGEDSRWREISASEYKRIVGLFVAGAKRRSFSFDHLGIWLLISLIRLDAMPEGCETLTKDEYETLPDQLYDELFHLGGVFKVFSIWAQKPE